MNDYLNKTWQGTFRQVRRVVVAVFGVTLLLIGLAMVVLPGPAFVVIPLGLAVLGTEFVWARRWLKKARELVHRRNKNGQAVSQGAKE